MRENETLAPTANHRHTKGDALTGIGFNRQPASDFISKRFPAVDQF
jgi:hypothetical protein